jgi:hypothetical protein
MARFISSVNKFMFSQLVVFYAFHISLSSVLSLRDKKQVNDIFMVWVCACLHSLVHECAWAFVCVCVCAGKGAVCVCEFMNPSFNFQTNWLIFTEFGMKHYAVRGYTNFIFFNLQQLIAWTYVLVRWNWHWCHLM